MKLGQNFTDMTSLNFQVSIINHTGPGVCYRIPLGPQVIAGGSPVVDAIPANIILHIVSPVTLKKSNSLHTLSSHMT